MGWHGGEWIPGTMCEDAPCCGCCGVNLYDNGEMVVIEIDYYDPDELLEED